MKNLSSIGDLARSHSNRLTNYQLKTKMTVLSREATTGLKSDIPKHLNGNLGVVAQIETSLKLFETYQRNAKEAETLFDTIQSVLTHLQSSSQEIGPSLIKDAALASESQIDLRLAQGKSLLEDTIRLLNTQVSGKFIFSGSSVETKPLVDVQEFDAALSSLITETDTITDITTKISNWINQPKGGGGYEDSHYLGSSQSASGISISNKKSITNQINAASPAIKNLLAGLLTLRAVSSSPASSDLSLKREALRSAGEQILLGGSALSLDQARTGFMQESISLEISKISASQSSFSISRNVLIASDEYESALALQQTEQSLLNLYHLTSRVSRLSLLDFVR